MASLAKQFMERFSGLERAHGQYTVTGLSAEGDKGKMTGSRGTHPDEPVTLELWEGHLAGRMGLGIIPIRDDATVRFAAADIDEYKVKCIECNGAKDGCEACEHRGWNYLDLVALQAKIVKLDLPLLVTRTKSGGAHLYIFFREPVKADLARAKLAEWVVALGYPGIEIFPKQSKLANENDVGNWINMPYAGVETEAGTNRYGIKPDGTPLTAKEYLKLAEKMAVADEDALGAIELPDVDEDWEDAPPCLQVLAAQGFSEGSRNNSLFNIAVYLRKRHGDDGAWQRFVDHYNESYIHPPLATREVGILSRSVNKKNYNYKCKDLPIVSVCNRAVCLTRLCGVSSNADDPGVVFGPLVKLKTDPPTWIWDVNGQRLELTTDAIMDQRKFQARCMEVLSIWPNPIKPATWNTMVREKLASIEEIDVPVDATKEGQLWSHLSDFCTSKVQGKALDEILMGKPFTDDKIKRTFFRGADFMQYLTQHRVSGVSERDLWRWLRRMEAEHHSQSLKGKNTNFWSVPAFPIQTEDFAVPRTAQESM